MANKVKEINELETYIQAIVKAYEPDPTSENFKRGYISAILDTAKFMNLRIKISDGVLRQYKLTSVKDGGLLDR
ncbi:MAG: hypothetical protein KGL39_54435 [Patescibacteria group bacterium]|nr:hypothetical protein [Patescibacteria group bacterium]